MCKGAGCGRLSTVCLTGLAVFLSAALCCKPFLLSALDLSDSFMPLLVSVSVSFFFSDTRACVYVWQRRVVRESLTHCTVAMRACVSGTMSILKKNPI